MLSRTLRAGQSLAFGFNMVSTEMPMPISKEFGRVFEEQNLGIPFDETLRSLSDRIPNLDLKFFVTALILQRQTGGDLAEILDEMGALIRDRFRIWGQIQALTGEGGCRASSCWPALRACSSPSTNSIPTTSWCCSRIRWAPKCWPWQSSCKSSGPW